MNEPIVEITRVNLYGDDKDAVTIAQRVKLDTIAYDDWLKQNEAEALAGYIEGQMERDFDDVLLDGLAGDIGYAAKCREVNSNDSN